VKLVVTLREESRLGLFENRVVRMPKSEEINRILMKMLDDFPSRYRYVHQIEVNKMVI
jgi:hypothetical protein